MHIPYYLWTVVRPNILKCQFHCLVRAPIFLYPRCAFKWEKLSHMLTHTWEATIWDKNQIPQTEIHMQFLDIVTLGELAIICTCSNIVMGKNCNQIQTLKGHPRITHTTTHKLYGNCGKKRCGPLGVVLSTKNWTWWITSPHNSEGVQVSNNHYDNYIFWCRDFWG